jgi:hypothetical protein
VINSWNSDDCAQYGTWDLNDNEVQDIGDGGASQYWAGAQGQRWAINNIPLTHTSKPAGYP